MTAPEEFGGRGFTQSGYCRIMEVIGGHCSSTAVFVNAHHSIGIRALLLFGTAEQKALWLPPLARGEKLAAFALTEKEAGSDASNVQTEAVPSEDGRTYRLTGTKRYITNGAIARRLDGHGAHSRPEGGRLEGHGLPGHARPAGLRGGRGADAQVRHPGHGDGPVGVPRHAGAGIEHPRPARQGPEGRADGARLRADNLRGELHRCGQTCLAAATRHAAHRRQFGRPLADLELIKKKLAYLAATAYAMEATTLETAALIDRGAEDYMLETAILKVFSTEMLWQGVYETLQVYGGQGYFSDEPYERDDARRPDQHDRRGGQRGPQGVHSRWSGCATSARASRRPSRG